MISESDLKPIVIKTASTIATAAQVDAGLPIPKGVRVRTFSPEAWEEFVEEWASTLDSKYPKVRRFGGAGDMGIADCLMSQGRYF